MLNTNIKKNILIRYLKSNIKYFRQVRKSQKEIKYLFEGKVEKLDGSIMKDEEKKIWKKSFLKYADYFRESAAIEAKAFCQKNVYIVKHSKDNIPDDAPILICNVKNDRNRIEMLLNYHKKIGIKYFAILDNDSDDGTYEWLCEQDIDLFSVKEKYTSTIRAGWINKIIQFYGMNRWYIIVDSDELLTYCGHENHDINWLTNKMTKNKLDCGMAVMVDMYNEESDLNATVIPSADDIYREYNRFDSDSYRVSYNAFFAPVIEGGPRNRFFGDDGNPELLTKYPLVYMRQGQIYGYHHIYPFEMSFESPCFLVLKHYKFVNGDMDKIKRIVREGNYADGSTLYKKYYEKLKETGKLSFVYEGTRVMENSEDIAFLNIYCDIKDLENE